MKGTGLIVAALLAAFLVTLAAHDLVCIVGKRGSGKSTFAKNLIAKQLAAGQRVAAWDPKDEYSRHGKKKKSVDLGPLRDRCTVDELLAHPEWLDAPDLSLAIVTECANTDDEGMSHDFIAVVEQIEGTGNMVFVVDEVGLLRDTAAKALLIVGTQSRHWGSEGTPVILVAQCLTLIEPKARKQASMLVTGAQHDPGDLAAIEEMVLPTLGKEGAAAFVQTVATQKRPGLVGWREAA